MEARVTSNTLKSQNNTHPLTRGTMKNNKVTFSSRRVLWAWTERPYPDLKEALQIYEEALKALQEAFMNGSLLEKSLHKLMPLCIREPFVQISSYFTAIGNGDTYALFKFLMQFFKFFF